CCHYHRVVGRRSAFSGAAGRDMTAPICHAGSTLMADRTCLAIVLAAGEGTRMRSARPKVLHQIGQRSLLAHVLEAARAARRTPAVVVGPNAEAVAARARR